MTTFLLSALVYLAAACALAPVLARRRSTGAGCGGCSAAESGDCNPSLAAPGRTD